MSVPIPIEPFGDAAMRARLPPGANVRAVSDALREHDGVVDAIVTPDHALVVFDPARPPKQVAAAIARALAKRTTAIAGVRHVIPVRYDGPDLTDVARAAGLTERELITLHLASPFVVSAVGFLPGFAYLTGLDPRVRIPRKRSPRLRVPALSVAVAGPYGGIYPFASPGGWNLIGTARGFTPFDPTHGVRLALGDGVRFVESQA